MNVVEHNIKYTQNRWTRYLKYFGHYLYTERIHYYLFYKYLNSIPKKWLKDKILVDIGFGTGFNIYNIYKKYKMITIGLDIVDETVNLYNNKKGCDKSYAKKIDPYIDNLPFKEGEVDFIICSHVLEHVPDDKHLLKEIYRVLKIDGMVFFNIPINEEDIYVPNHIRKYSSNKFKNMILQNKFKIINEYLYDTYAPKITYHASRKTFFHNIIKRSLIFILTILPISLTRNLFNGKPGQYAVFAKK